MDATREVVDEFVAEQLGAERSSLGVETTLYGDLELFGDDCDIFFLAFADRFSVSFEGVNFSDYFPPELSLGPRLLRMMARRITVSAEPHDVAQVTPLSIADLVQWAVHGSATGER